MAKRNQSAFEKALTDAVLSHYQTILDEDPSPIQLSDAYKASIDKLTHKSSRKTWKYVNRAWKRVLIAAILMFLLAATAVAAVPALREGLIRFFIHDDGIVYSFEFAQEDIEHAPKKIQTYYAPSQIPNQFSLVDEVLLPEEAHRYYMDDSGNVLDYRQFVLWAYTPDLLAPDGVATRFGVSSEKVTVETVIIQGYEVKVIHIQTPNDTEDVEILWTDHEYFFAVGSPEINFEEIGRIIGSMAPIEP